MPTLPSKMRISIAGFVACLIVLASADPGGVAAVARADVGRVGEQADRSGAPVELGGTAFGKFLASRHAETIGDFATAAKLTAEVLAENPGLTRIVQRGHWLMASAGRIPDAAELAERVLIENDRDPIANLTLAVRAFGDAHYRDVLRRLDYIDATGIQRIVVPLLRAWALAGDGRTAQALEVIEELNATDGLGPIAGLHAGLIADLAGQSQAAEAAFQRGVAQSGDTIALQLVQAYAGWLARHDEHDAAVHLVEAFIRSSPQTLLIEPTQTALAEGRLPPPLVMSASEGAAEALHAVANLLNRERLRPQALIFAQLALHLRAQNPATLFLLGRIFDSEGQVDAALRAYRQIAPASPYGWYARLSLADGLREQGEGAQAIRLLREMVRERSDRSDAPRILGDFLRIDERYREAVTAYDQALERVGGAGDWRVYYTRGIALERAKQWERAERDFLKALELEPEQPLVLNYLGYSWVEQGENLDRAKAMIERAVAQRPQDGFITDSLGWVLYRLGDYEGAVSQLERAVSLEPGDPVINDHLGDAYWLVGRRAEARFQWRRALSQNPEPDAAEAIRAKLEGRKTPRPLPPGERRDI